jgi:branched-chain amino acid transport system ATP-binding protein
VLEADQLTSGYGEVTAIADVSLDVRDEVFAVLGANGAGKTTLLKALARLLPAMGGAIRLNGGDISRTPAHLLAARGLAYVPQEANVFPRLSVLENLRIGGRIGVRRWRKSSTASSGCSRAWRSGRASRRGRSAAARDRCSRSAAR